MVSAPVVPILPQKRDRFACYYVATKISAYPFLLFVQCRFRSSRNIAGGFEGTLKDSKCLFRTKNSKKALIKQVVKDFSFMAASPQGSGFEFRPPERRSVGRGFGV